MRISLNWLSEYISVPFIVGDGPVELSDRLTMLGIEVEAIERPAEKMAKVVVGEVLEVTPHPNADKLRLAKVNIGAAEPLRIVCGAPNVRAGLKVPVALIGADLGEGFVIKKSKIRGETSEGMICSERELGISNKHEGIWELPLEFETGAPLATALGLEDVIFEIGITPNRADCLSHIGIAREIRAITGEMLQLPEIKIAPTGGEIAGQVRISLPEPELCPRYVAKLVRGVTIAPSPDWLKRRLEAVGLRPINNVVDVTNFVLMEYGHPLHAFDFDVVESGQIVVRTAKGFADEYVTLDGKTRKLPPGALLITDGKKPLGIAGIMGGENSEIRDTTRNVLIESAYFQPASIRRTAKALGLSTDASYRFERGTDFDVLRAAAERAAQMIVELGGGEAVGGLVDEYPAPIARKEFRFRPARANMLIGMPTPEARIREIFARLDIEIASARQDEWTLRSPSYRIDLEREEDAIEEVARLVGYDEIPTSAFEGAPLGMAREPLSLREFDELLRSTLIALGATECVSVPIIARADAARFDPAPVALLNPLNAERDHMRTSIAINLLDAARVSERFGAGGGRIFEVGNVFSYATKPQQLGHVLEKTQIGLLLFGEQVAKSAYNAQAIASDIFAVKGLVNLLLTRCGLPQPAFRPADVSYLHRGESLEVSAGGKIVGTIGKLDAAIAKQYDLRHDAYLALLDHPVIYELARSARAEPKHVKPLPKYPSMERDIALVLDRGIAAQTVESAIQQAAPGLLIESIRLFDEFQSKEMKGARERSLAFHLVFRSTERTLEEKEVDEITHSIIKHLEGELHARLRA
ncbi:MAG: phenylalanine--tRNA ligase subunit beta [Bacteroidota bacterium]|nr:phenylalanine--tRNA ligase subunit beta [Bacteroidota bacterium]MDP4234242.1 phenylalanine--tRNA ligase subunit beta [Bacteroidota bacterium]MDP4243432.1 phenylalanine--tRNA ligase subunit beta [Bacteroidota bacterium]MDP4288131.1 phenylalanine--tRNA ligase subunit beta [Bacteroidota bacterium]